MRAEIEKQGLKGERLGWSKDRNRERRAWFGLGGWGRDREKKERGKEGKTGGGSREGELRGGPRPAPPPPPRPPPPPGGGREEEPHLDFLI